VNQPAATPAATALVHPLPAFGRAARRPRLSMACAAASIGLMP
jgi:hypothetical protein